MDAPLLNLSGELWADILDLLDDDSLAALASVKTNCRQISLSYQFMEALFEFGDLDQRTSNESQERVEG